MEITRSALYSTKSLSRSFPFGDTGKVQINHKHKYSAMPSLNQRQGETKENISLLYGGNSGHSSVFSGWCYGAGEWRRSESWQLTRDWPRDSRGNSSRGPCQQLEQLGHQHFSLQSVISFLPPKIANFLSHVRAHFAMPIVCAVDIGRSAGEIFRLEHRSQQYPFYRSKDTSELLD